ncbi:hypothetical protein DB826_23135, partial [Xanthomonas perforans]
LAARAHHRHPGLGPGTGPPLGGGGLWGGFQPGGGGGGGGGVAIAGGGHASAGCADAPRRYANCTQLPATVKFIA